MTLLDHAAIAMVGGGQSAPASSPQDQADEWFAQNLVRSIIDEWISQLLI